MNVLTDAAAFAVVLGVMIFFHEFGHFITAKAFGMRVFIFSFGFGRRLLGFKWGDTDCRLSLIPLGGYVKLEGEPDDYVSESTAGQGDGRDFTSRPRWQRILVYLAGPAMNGVLTISVLTVLFMVGFQVDATLYDRPIIGAVEAGSPAAQAGLVPGDRILSINGTPQATWESAQYAVLVRPDEELALEVERDGRQREVKVRSQATSTEKVGTIGVAPLVRIGEVLSGAPAAQAGLQSDDAILAIDGRPIKTFADIVPIVQAGVGKSLEFRIYRHGRILSVPVVPRDDGEGPRVGIGRKMVVRQFGPIEALDKSVAWSWAMTRQTFDILGRLLTAKLSPKTMEGPLGIAQASGDAARSGPIALFTLIAIISLQIGILNLFPVPPLDGGHLAILLGESVVRRDFSIEVKTWILNAGAMLVLLLIVVVVYSDLSKTSFFGRFLP